jgi:hypothetical protein
MEIHSWKWCSTHRMNDVCKIYCSGTPTVRFSPTWDKATHANAWSGTPTPMDQGPSRTHQASNGLDSGRSRHIHGGSGGGGIGHPSWRSPNYILCSRCGRTPRIPCSRRSMGVDGRQPDIHGVSAPSSTLLSLSAVFKPTRHREDPQEYTIPLDAIQFRTNVRLYICILITIMIMVNMLFWHYYLEYHSMHHIQLQKWIDWFMITILSLKSYLIT